MAMLKTRRFGQQLAKGLLTDTLAETKKLSFQVL
jgi:hypothetical protein